MNVIPLSLLVVVLHMTAAKGIGIVASNGGNIRDYEGVDKSQKPCALWLPSTPQQELLLRSPASVSLQIQPISKNGDCRLESDTTDRHQ